MKLLDRDLAAWEEGELTLDEVERRHPGEGVQGLVDLHISLSLLAAEPAPTDADRTWAQVERRLNGQKARRPVVLRVLRPALATAAALVLATGAAYAAGVEPVREAVDRAWDAVVDVLGGRSVRQSPPAVELEHPSTTEPARTAGHGAGAEGEERTGIDRHGDQEGGPGPTADSPGTRPAPTEQNDPGQNQSPGNDEQTDGHEGDQGSDEPADENEPDPPEDPVDDADDDPPAQDEDAADDEEPDPPED